MTHINDDNYRADDPHVITSVAEIDKGVLLRRPQYLVAGQYANTPDPTQWSRFSMRRVLLSFPKNADRVYRENTAENQLNVRYYANPDTGEPGYAIQLDHHDPVSDPVGHFVEDTSPEQKAVLGLGIAGLAAAALGKQ